ncbi:serine/threonine-protein phosphatase 6 regulatory subunit family [Trichomonas vaginalis G3]|uniref:serine/threonine-protein phosphatase 6 regulatory subunit family n=1 Tax=Trichomonas vaginalis (strain ATCC PRA-98 / G3) TaxID=412133 RepID=UPI0021E595AF|nr:serine/threonine-protein phosphatase 6 regulatory subunit family [Trichomonas vaginalis G3]KAI5484185.1 serine/threonine-protein phosphatase 6 regulatory subunit family [Trichomonas vaginalis G3]
MTGYEKPSFPQSISELIKKPETTLDDIIFDPNISHAIESPIQEFVDFLSREDILNSLMDYTLTTKMMKKEHFRRSAVICISLLTSDILGFETKLIQNGFLLNQFKQFINSEYSKDPMVSGHFQRILISSARLSSGKIIRDFPELKIYLFTHMHNLALRELVIVLATDFKESFDFTIETIKKICQHLPSVANPYNFISAFRIICKLQSHHYNFFNDPQIVETILNIGVTTQDPLLASECFLFVEKLTHCFPFVHDLVNKFENKYTFDASKVTCATATALKLFKTGVPTFIDSFFQNKGNTGLDLALIHIISEVPDDQLSNIIKEHKIVNRIIETFGKSKTNGQITAFAQYIAARTKNIPELQTDEWIEFVSTKLTPRIKLRDTPYAGGIPHSAFSTYDDHAVYPDTEFNIAEDDFNEEEVFSDGHSSADNSFDCYDDYDEEPVEKASVQFIETQSTSPDTVEPRINRFIRDSSIPNLSDN